MTIKLYSGLQNRENSHIVTVDLSPSSSNRSWLVRKQMVIGGVIGVAVTAATAYFFINKALTETTFSTNTTETSTAFFTNTTEASTTFSTNTTEASTEYFVDSTKLPMNESIRSLYNIATRLVTTEDGYHKICADDFQDHWERFKECGITLNKCMQNSIKLFSKLFCKPPTNHFGYIDDHSEECENTYRALARCDM